MTAGQLGRLGVIGVMMAALVGPSAGARSETVEPVAVNVAGQGWPWLSMSDGRPVPMALAGRALADEGESSLGMPRALAAGDFDEDGIPDLVSAYAGTGGGLLVLHRGNVDSIYPEAPGAQARRAAGTATAAPFLPAVRAFSMPEAPDFLAVGDFDNDGHLDVVTAAAGSTRLSWRRGDGHGGLGAPEAMGLDGAVTALAVGDDDGDRSQRQHLDVLGLRAGPRRLVGRGPGLEGNTMSAGQFGRLGVIGVAVAALVGPSAGARSETASGGSGPGSDIGSPKEAGIVSPVCGRAFGTRFNREPRPGARAQDSPGLDFLPGGVGPGVDLIVGVALDGRGGAGLLDGSTTGYYVSRNADCAAEFEGGFPATANPFPGGGDPLRGDGHSVVAADPVRGAIFAADERVEALGFVRAIGVFRTTRATLLSPIACPNGTHTAAQAKTCWPTRRVLAVSDHFVAGVHLAVDERATGVGAANVYIVYSREAASGDWLLQLVTCTNTLRACASPVTVAHTVDLSYPHVAVRPDGIVGVTWTDHVLRPVSRADIFYAACIPRGAPAAPVCGQTQLVHQETQSFEGRTGNGVLSGWSFELKTYPKHDNRVGANGIETFVVWDRCKVPPTVRVADRLCPDADIVMKTSLDMGRTWSELQCVSCAAGHQFLPWIRTDRARNVVNLTYYSAPANARGFQVRLSQIRPGRPTPDPLRDVFVITTILNDVTVDPTTPREQSVGDRIGVAARATGAAGQSRAYVHHTSTAIPGVYGGRSLPEQNNHLSRLDY